MLIVQRNIGERGRVQEEEILSIILKNYLIAALLLLGAHVMCNLQLTHLFYSIYFVLFYSILYCVLPLQEVALHQSPSTFSVLCCPCPYCSLLPHNVISPSTFWSSNWSYTFYLPLCASESQSIIFHSGDVSSSFPFRISYILNYVTGYLLDDGITDSLLL